MSSHSYKKSKHVEKNSTMTYKRKSILGLSVFKVLPGITSSESRKMKADSNKWLATTETKALGIQTPHALHHSIFLPLS